MKRSYHEAVKSGRPSRHGVVPNKNTRYQVEFSGEASEPGPVVFGAGGLTFEESDLRELDRRRSKLAATRAAR